MKDSKKVNPKKKRSASQIVVREILAPQRTHLGTGSKLKPDIHHQLFEGLDDSHVDIVKAKDSKISELQAKLDHDLK